jgi:hypothetical protein
MSASAVRRIHQPVQRHHFAQEPGASTQPGVGEDRVQLQQTPDLMAHVHRPGFACVVERDTVGIDREAWPAGARRTGAGGERLDRGIGHERRLPRQRGVKPTCGAEPLVLRRRRQGAERADHTLARALRGRNRFDEQIILVGLVTDAPGGAAEIHAIRSVSLLSSIRQVKYQIELVTISNIDVVRARNPAYLRRGDGRNRPFHRPLPWKLG